MNSSSGTTGPGVLVASDVTAYTALPGAPNGWTERLRAPTASLGTYCIPAGGTDDQVPHREDEIYLVTAGSATLLAGGQRIAARPGVAVFVAAGVDHRFVDVAEDLTVVVLFTPPYTGR